MKIIASFIFSLILGNSFLYSQAVIPFSEQKRYYEQNKIKYELSKYPFKLSDTELISTNAIYIHKFFPVIQSQHDTSFSFYKFFSDGRIFASGTYLSVPNKEERVNYIYGYFGRYILNDSTVTIEIYSGFGTGVWFFFGKCSSERISLYKMSRKLSGGGIDKQKMKLELNSFWKHY